MKVCQNCGNQVEDSVIFCTNCGVEIKSAEQQAPQSAQPVTQQAPQQNVQQGAPVFVNAQQAPYQQPIVYNDPKDHTNEFDANDIADNKLFGAACYLFEIFGIIIALLVNTPYTRFHAKNAIRYDIALLLCFIPCIIPILGWLVTGIACLVLFVIKIIAIVWSLQGKAKELPIISDIGFLK
ncbi:Uncharacterized membrane protein [Butyrivibrio sp. INlla18]|uniref:DUF4870 domain-containing protein n=1 Tax=Butyrivibrio sp. INlla18 TaxID=1520806 RepID=UPI0008872C13|nr:zinc-ribbon domain-containing protein [Butyrivibrio sp. INlla18]SDA61146.1 Uncharacterized membrane protein [Butyrivibrio sp. INlla18]